MEKIESLTQEQIDSMPRFRDKWINIGLSLSEGTPSYSDLKDRCAVAYEVAGLEPPKFHLFPRGPKEAMQFLTFAPKCNLTKEDFEELSAKSPTALTEKLREMIGSDSDYKFNMPSFYGNHEAAWLGFHDFFAEHFGLSEQSAGLRELAKIAGWCWFYKDLAIISDKPTKIVLRNKLLHNENGPAIEFADGLKIYAFNGTRLPEKWVMEKDTIDSSEILAHRDTDVRAAGIALVGYQKMKHQLGYKILDGDPETDIGALIELKIPGLSRPGRFLEAICPRNGPVFLGIPQNNPWDDEKPINSAVGAQAFLARLPESAYQHPPIRT